MREFVTFFFVLCFSLCRSQRGYLFANNLNVGGNIRMSLFDNDRHMFGGVGNMNFDAKKLHFTSGTGGLTYDNARGFGLSLTNTHISKLGNQLTGSGHINLMQNDNHLVSASAFLSHSMPINPKDPEFQTLGGSLDYNFKNKVGASIAAARTPFHQQTDYSVSGNLNLLREGRTSVDLDVGVCKTQSPFMKGSWEPSVKLEIKTTF